MWRLHLSLVQWSYHRSLRHFWYLDLDLHRYSIVETQIRNCQPTVAPQTKRVGCGMFRLLHRFCFLVTVYYLPIWFKAVKGVSAYDSGIRNIPILLSVFIGTIVIGTILSGGLVTKVGYYTLFMLASTVLTPIGAGFLTTLDLDTGSPEWIDIRLFVVLAPALDCRCH
jgi:hypothetical protein